MPRKRRPSPFAQDIVQMLKDSIRDADLRDDVTLSHRIPVISPVGGVSLVFTVDVTLRRAGRYLATCREFPGLFVVGGNEHEALMLVERQIRQRLADGSN